MGLAGELVREFEADIQKLEIVPSDGGRFEVGVNGTIVFSKKQLARHAEAGEVVGLIRKIIEG